MGATTVEITTVGLAYKSVPHFHNLAYELSTVWSDDVIDCLVVANDPTTSVIEAIDCIVRGGPPLDHIRERTRFVVYRDPKPDDWYLARVYRAWNYALSLVETSHVILMNSDMIGTKGWVNALVKHYKPNTIICSRLIQRRMLAGNMIGGDFGTIPNVQIGELETFAKVESRPRLEEGGFFQPCLAATDDLLKCGGFPEGNVKMPERKVVHEPARPRTSVMGGDAYHFHRIGIEHYTAYDSLVYHEYEGEMCPEK